MTAKVSTADLAGLRSAIGRLATAPDAELSRQELAAASRTACALLAARYPGGTVELRVPPFAAVQLGIGQRGRHTRGTPPNVVETDPLTLLRLAGGLLSWAHATQSHRLRASGELSDLSALWPIEELR